MSADRLVTITTTHSQARAQQIRLVLEMAGIRVFIQNENTASNLVHYGAIIGLDIQVPQEAVAEAKKILGDHLPEQASAPVCPLCGSNHIAIAGLLSKWGPVVLFYVIALKLRPSMRNTFRCGDCGHQWKITDSVPSNP